MKHGPGSAGQVEIVGGWPLNDHVIMLASTSYRTRIHLSRIIQLPYEARFDSKYLESYGKGGYTSRTFTGNLHVCEVCL